MNTELKTSANLKILYSADTSLGDHPRPREYTSQMIPEVVTLLYDKFIK